MSALKTIQKDFYQSVFQTHPIQDLDWISSSDAAERFKIYRQTIFTNLKHSLSLTFPGIWSLLGENCANSVAHAFCQQARYLPTSGCLDEWGESFSDFLGSFKALAKLPYLKDYARYEWLKHLAYQAKATDPIKPALFNTLTDDIIEKLHVCFIPSLFSFKSDLPIQNIQNLIDNPKAPEIKLTQTKTYAIIARAEHEVLTFWINESLWYFIIFLKEGLNLTHAFEKIQKQAPLFDLTQAIYFLLQKKLIAKLL